MCPITEKGYSLVDLNRAGVPLLEIVSEPDMHTWKKSAPIQKDCAPLLRCLGVNSGDMEKGVIRFEANVSVRPVGSQIGHAGRDQEPEQLPRAGARHSLPDRAADRADQGGQAVRQETLGWDEARGVTYSQRSKEEAHDYRYFPEPDLPPLVVEPNGSSAWQPPARTARMPSSAAFSSSTASARRCAHAGLRTGCFRIFEAAVAAAAWKCFPAHDRELDHR
jgi:Asp-tRNA(Asn)/Glu-tRNA(Gln) amidotransferase B subunit